MFCTFIFVYAFINCREYKLPLLQTKKILRAVPDFRYFLSVRFILSAPMLAVSLPALNSCASFIDLLLIG